MEQEEYGKEEGIPQYLDTVSSLTIKLNGSGLGKEEEENSATLRGLILLNYLSPSYILFSFKIGCV